MLCAAALLLLAGHVICEEDELFEPWADNCETMDPSNGTAPQAGPPPFTLTLSQTSISGARGVYLTLSTNPGASHFRGFMVQARDSDGEAVGEFDTCYTDVFVMNCFGQPDNTAMHRDFQPKKSVRMRWVPTDEDDATVSFYVTVAVEIAPLIYWRRYKSGSLRINKAK